MTIWQVITVGVVLIAFAFTVTYLGVEIYALFRRKGLTRTDMETAMAEGDLRYEIQRSLQQQFTTNSAWMTFCDQCLAESRDRQIGIWVVYREKHVQLQIKQWWTAWCLMWGVIGHSTALHAAIFEPQPTSEHVKLDSSSGSQD